MPNTVPNQRTVQVHREPARTNFLGIKNENWMKASRDLGAYALQLYLYFAANADNYSFALSPVAVRREIGMARSTYNDQFNKLVDKGYLVNRSGNTYDFYETPQPDTQSKPSSLGRSWECPQNEQPQTAFVENKPQGNREININSINNIDNQHEKQPSHAVKKSKFVF